jgi:peptidyl-prolyl cis-trans isomerase SurA
MKKSLVTLLVLLAAGFSGFAQKYPSGLVDKTVAVVGNEVILISDIEDQVQQMTAQGYASDRNMRCELLESMMESKLFLMQARLDSLTVNYDMVDGELGQRLDRFRTYLGGDEEVEKYFGKPLYRLRQEWRKTLEDQSLTQQEQAQVANSVPELTPYDVKQFLDTTAVEDLPVVPVKYQLSQIAVYPDREAANMAVKEKLLSLRERIINGEKFSTLARIYSEDPGSARKGGELGLASKSIFWPAFSDAAMALRPGIISQIVETPDGFHIIQMIEKKGDMFNARHILIKPAYTVSDRNKAFARLDSIKTAISENKVSFEMAALINSEDPKTRTNGGMMVDEYTGSSLLEKDRLNPADYAVIKDMKAGDVSEPFESLDTEGRGNTIYKIVRLDEELPAHTAAFETDYDALVSMANEKNARKAIEDFVTEKKKTTHIKIDPLFEGCKFVSENWIEK